MYRTDAPIAPPFTQLDGIGHVIIKHSAIKSVNKTSSSCASATAPAPHRLPREGAWGIKDQQKGQRHAAKEFQTFCKLINKRKRRGCGRGGGGGGEGAHFSHASRVTGRRSSRLANASLSKKALHDPTV